MSDRKKKIRVSFQKNRESRRREGDFTRKFDAGDAERELDLASSDERVRGKGDVSRKRTIFIDETTGALAIDADDCRLGRVLMVQGLSCVVVTDDGQSHRCFVRRLLKSLDSDERSVLAPGDWVRFKPAPGNEGMIARVEPRGRVLTRRYRQREHVIAANVDQALIVSALVEPDLKPHLIDRYLVSAARGNIRPILCLNKVDLIAPSRAQPLIGLYSQLGYAVALTSAETGQGLDQLRDHLRGHETVIVGQSGVGKSSLLNALEPTFHLKVREVSAATNKGKHTTTTAQLLQWSEGGVLIDTPGVRQFELWEMDTASVEDYFREIPAFSKLCHFPGCRHHHEDACAVRQAVNDHQLSPTRYESYLKLLVGDGTVADDPNEPP